VVRDGPPAHRARLVSEFIRAAGLARDWAAARLPPELNPVEYIWG
jgi:transposase